ncbi:MAG TPA: P-II family nitrogen regulator [Vicinamibacteria bacterium]|nr:P-II family nitrogen regulator [Vicinamibacteria bacterium]
MKYVLAFMPPDRLDALVDALEEAHVHGLSVSEARGFGQEHDPTHPEHHDHPGVDLVRKLRVEIVCRDEEVESILGAFERGLRSARAGAGKVFVLDVRDALRLKTGERGEAAIGPGASKPPR